MLPAFQSDLHIGIAIVPTLEIIRFVFALKFKCRCGQPVQTRMASLSTVDNFNRESHASVLCCCRHDRVYDVVSLLPIGLL